MTDGYVYDPLDQTTFEIIAYNAVGRASETGTYPAYSLVHSTGNSGWSVGFMQWDFGQPGRGHKVDEMLAAYQEWPDGERRFDERELASLSTRLQTRGQVGNALTADERSRLNSFLRSDNGRDFVNGLDREQINLKWQNVGHPLSGIAWLQELNRTDPAQTAEIVAMTSKLYNQNTTRGARLIQHLQDNELTSDQAGDWIENQGIQGLNPSARAAIASGRDNALTGIRLMNALETGEGQISRLWREAVHDNGNVGLTQDFNTDPTVQLLDSMMRDAVSGERIRAHVEDRAAAQAVVITGINEAARAEMARTELNRQNAVTVRSPDGNEFRLTREGWAQNGVLIQDMTEVVPEYQRRFTPAAPISPFSLGPQRPEASPVSPAHPDHALFEQTLGKVREANDKRAERWDEASVVRVAASLMLQVKQDPLVKRVDEVVMSRATPNEPAEHLAFAVYKPFGDNSPYFHAHVETHIAVNTPAEQAFQRMEEFSRQQAQQSALDQQRQHTQQQDGAGRAITI